MASLVVVLQPLSHVQLFTIPWTAARQASLFHHLPEFAWINDAIQPSHPLSPLSPALNLSHHQGLFQWVDFSHQMAKILELQFQHQSFQWIFRVDLPAVQGTLKSLLHHNSEASILQRSAFFTVQLSHPYMTTRKTTALTIQTLVVKSSLWLLICYLGWS